VRVDSRPGRTEFAVWLPTDAPAPSPDDRVARSAAVISGGIHAGP
jgi:hypothetical protein